MLNHLFTQLSSINKAGTGIPSSTDIMYKPNKCLSQPKMQNIMIKTGSTKFKLYLNALQ